MKRTVLLFLFSLVLIEHSAFAKGHNNNEKSKVLTLSNGRYDEFFDQDSIEQIGSVLFNVNSQKIVGFVDETKGTKATLKPEIISRWLSVDPLAAKFPSISPYVFCGNNPIRNIDPDGRAFVVADKAQQATALGYFHEQFGSDIFKFKNGNMSVDKKAYAAASSGFNAEQKSMAEGLIKIVKSDRVLEAQFYDNQNVNFNRNPIVTETVMKTDPATGAKVATENSHPMFTGKGYVIPTLGQEALTLNINGDDRAFILMDTKASATATFKAADGKTTNPCASCLFIHEALDHGLGYINTGTVPGNTPANVNYQNDALQNVGSATRTGEDHVK